MKLFASFLTPYAQRALITKVPKASLLQLQLTPRQVYDVLSVATLVAASVGQFDSYPDKEHKRADVEVFASVMAVLYYATHTLDPQIFSYLWVIGTTSYVMSLLSLRSGNVDDANAYHAGLHLVGQMSLILVFMNFVTPR